MRSQNHRSRSQGLAASLSHIQQLSQPSNSSHCSQSRKALCIFRFSVRDRVCRGQRPGKSQGDHVSKWSSGWTGLQSKSYTGTRKISEAGDELTEMELLTLHQSRRSRSVIYRTPYWQSLLVWNPNNNEILFLRCLRITVLKSISSVYLD